MTTPSCIFSGSHKNNANLDKSPQVINAMNLGMAMRCNLTPWREIAKELRILKDNGDPDTGQTFEDCGRFLLIDEPYRMDGHGVHSCDSS